MYSINIYLWKYSSGNDNTTENENNANIENISSNPMVRANMSSSPRFSPRPPRRGDSPYVSPALKPQQASSLVAATTEVTQLTTDMTSHNIRDMSLYEQLQTWPFFFILIFASIGVLRANLYIGINEQLLFNLGGIYTVYLS